MKKALIILSLVQLVLIALMLLSPVLWIYVGFIVFIKFLGASIVVYITTYVFEKGFEKALTKTNLDNMKESDKSKTYITRFEYITDKGRQDVEYGEFEFQLQDDDRTLKVFKV